MSLAPSLPRLCHTVQMIKGKEGTVEGKEVPFPGSLETQNLKPDIITLPVREAVGVYRG